jgi:tRNA dimethylallyltransferase
MKPDISSAPSAFLIAGPTASGKSALALAIAEAFNGAIINADSMQVYDTLRVLTARPDEADLARVPHYLYGHVAPQDDYSVGHWVTDARAALAQVRADGQVPVFTGGTGLYFRALLHGLTDIPDIPAALREGLRQRLEDEGVHALHAELEARDPKLAARLHPNDPQRILRGLEVVEATGRTLSDWQGDAQNPLLSEPATNLMLAPSRDWLYARCDARFQTMLADGAAQAEIAALSALHLPPQAMVLKALGVVELQAVAGDGMDVEAAIAQAQMHTRRYAKRQMTWFRNQMSDWPRFTEQDYEYNFANIFSFVSKK